MLLGCELRMGRSREVIIGCCRGPIPMSADLQAEVRPDLKVLRRLPTIHQVAETWGKLELKLETIDTRYWLTTEGVARKTSGMPINYVVDYVTVEKKTKDGDWDLKAVYSPEAWKLSQGLDYCQLLYAELEDLRKAQERRFSWENVTAIESVERELELANKAVLALSEKVRMAGL